MSRPLRIQFPGAYYHVMNRGVARRATFLDPSDHGRFTALLEDIATRWQVQIHAYCCMANHYHILLQIPLGNLARIMRHLGGLYTQGFNRAYHRDGPLFRGRYKAIVVDAETYLLQVVRYIHLNPVAVGLTHDPGAYPWTSHRLYRQRTAPDWLARDAVLASFPDLPAFEQFVAEGNEESLEAFYASQRWRPISAMTRSPPGPSPAPSDRENIPAPTTPRSLPPLRPSSPRSAPRPERTLRPSSAVGEGSQTLPETWPSTSPAESRDSPIQRSCDAWVFGALVRSPRPACGRPSVLARHPTCGTCCEHSSPSFLETTDRRYQQT